MEMQVCDSAFCKILRPQTFWLSPHLLGAASTDVITGPPVQLQSTDLFWMQLLMSPRYDTISQGGQSAI